MAEGRKTQASRLLTQSAQSWAADIKNEAAFYYAENDELFMLLAARTTDPTEAFGPPSDRFKASFAPEALPHGPVVADLGKKIFRRCARALHDFLCSPNDEDQELRDKIKVAILDKDVSAVTIIAGGLVAAIGLSAPVALIVATLINKIIVAPTVDTLCEVWDGQIQAASRQTPGQ